MARLPIPENSMTLEQQVLMLSSMLGLTLFVSYALIVSRRNKKVKAVVLDDDSEQMFEQINT